MTEDFSVFFDAAIFGESALLDGAAITVIRDDASVEAMDGGYIGDEPSALVPTSEVPDAAVGQTLDIGSQAFVVRQVRLVPPDGKITRLILAEA